MVFVAFHGFVLHFVSDRNERLKQLFTFHRSLLHFVNDRNSRFREALEAHKKWKIEFSKMMLFR